MRLVPLPPTLSSSIPTIRWPLGPSSSPPLHFEPLEKLPKIRSKSPQGKHRRPIDEIADDVPTTINNLLSSSSFSSSDDITIDQKHHLHISLALLLLGHGYTDEAHDLVTPLSWPDDTHFGYGPVLYSTTSPSALSLATYTHSLVHRREGYNVGEFGMVGFSNANYWSNAALKSRGVDAIPFGDIRKAVLDVGKGNAEGERWCQERVVDEGGMDDEEYWESRALHELCGRVMRMVGEEDGDSGGGDEGGMLRDFAERAAEVELRVLLRHALLKAGYEEVGDCLRLEEEEKLEEGDGGGANGPSPSFTSDSTKTAPTANKVSAVDESVALSAANRVSSAHLNSFRTSGDVTLRNVLCVDQNSNNRIEEGASMSASAGIAARLLGSPACRRVSELDGANEDDANVVVLTIILPTTDSDVESASRLISEFTSGSGGGSLSIGDVMAIAVAPRQLFGDVNGGSLGRSCTWVQSFVACSEDDPRAIFVDRLHGARGETPTTVVQWSKRTVF